MKYKSAFAPGLFKGEVMIVTGGGSGIGAASVRRFVEEGAKVLIADMTDKKAAPLADELGDAAEFFQVLDEFNCVRAVLWGHVHQEIDTERNGVRLLASPSTCVQFAPGCENFKADAKPPGYRWLDLAPGGEVTTGVSRVADVEFEVDLESGGYL